MPLDSTEPTAIGDETLVSRGTSLMAALVAHEMLMMSEATGRYFGLDDIGTDIWRRLETPRTFKDIVDGLAADYEGDRAVIAADVRKLLLDMAAHGAVTLGSTSAKE